MVTVYLNVTQYCALRGEDVYTFTERWDIETMYVRRKGARGYARGGYRLEGTRAAWARLLPDAYRRAHPTQARSAIRNAIQQIMQALHG